ncbi:unnamed protein product [Linum trigynum]|uniref:Uncharacterized protein n=1 Tax=Linum trigynum TaxID=586398 RepID=A0AAV2FCM7_9ROSI
MEVDVQRKPNPALQRRQDGQKSLRPAKGGAPGKTKQARAENTQRQVGEPAADPNPHAAVREATRRRRLILEEESEDEFIVQSISPNRKGDTQRLPGKMDGGRPNPSKTAAHHRECGQLGNGPGKEDLPSYAPTLNDGPEPNSRLPKASAKPAKAKRLNRPSKAVQDPKGAVNKPELPKGEVQRAGHSDPTDSVDSVSESEAQSFEIRRRSPVVMGKMWRPAHSTKVSQVVRAIEQGLAMRDDEEVPDNGENQAQGSMDRQKPILDTAQTTSFNEYGTNLSDPEMGAKKRQFDEMEGVIEDNPTPKRQFVEDKDGVEKVEEASLEWPQLVK